MTHFASSAFWRHYRALTEETRKAADEAFAKLKENPRHPSLHFKKVGRFRSARVGLRYRALAVEASEGLIWFWIGTHSEYDRMVE